MTGLLIFFVDSCDVRIIMRDIAGKYVWDATQLCGLVPELSKKSPPAPPHKSSDAETEADSKTKLDFLALVSSRQTYKFAVIYIGPGQEDKQSILSNPRGSIEFERFVSSLGWSVNLATHHGFKGGLQYPEDGDIATYFANPTVEAIFHVPNGYNGWEFKHLGNDEVMIIWTEHWRAFRRSSLRTEFGDVLIIISPLSNGLFRVEIRKEPEVRLTFTLLIPFFGPLIDGMLVPEEYLPFLVRATAIQANSTINSRKPSFKEQYALILPMLFYVIP
ncbi:unnamed protein product [Hymenolepis diminuta]|uniref:Rap-GAP domain-containing protein n=1 Tax=Hymenolepis diminuta TaxID=6216 RepID=A0A0R3SKK5_HYMDI|nr:unnamed protein product [Hymenolepis diminuta]